MSGPDEEDDFPATQPVMSVLLKGVVAYVEVRSGHDNRSKGVKAHMRSLGATIEETLNRKVTHVVFNEGLPSTYKKAKKFKCHLVSVLWIEACKEASSKVSEAGYPPIGQQIYENPDSLKNYKKMKSMQPDFDDEEREVKTKKMLKKIAQSRRKSKTAAVPSINESDEDSVQNIQISKGRQQTTRKPNKRGPRSKNAPKKTALQEITPDVVNKEATSDVLVISSDESTTSQNVDPLCTANVSQGSSTLPQNEAGHSKNNAMKSRKARDDTPITRQEFIEGLNKVCQSISFESELNKSEISPWRKNVGPPPVKIRRKNPPVKKVSPRRSPRNASDSSDCFLFPAAPARRSPRNVNGITKISKKMPTQIVQAPSACVSASAALLRKKMPAAPSSPGDDFILLSQEPGDMPSIDEMAKLRRGSIRAGDERITLSQVIKSYNAVAQENAGTQAQKPGSSRGLSQESDSNFTSESCNSHRALKESSAVDVDDEMACDSEVGYCTSRCSSEAGSTVSSTSTKVLINGHPPSEVGCSSNLLPSSGEVQDQVGTAEREPSPIFVIKKSKFRRPLKKQSDETKTCGSSSGTEKKNVPLSSAKLKVVSSSSDEKRQSLNPIDYINKLFLPKFVDKTPNNLRTGNVIVEETPEIDSAKSAQEESTIIPPTPAGNQEAAASPNQSLTSSVISWVKKSCRVPLFIAQSKREAATPPVLSRKDAASKEVSNDVALSSQASAATEYYSFSKETDNADAESENPVTDLNLLVRPSQLSSKSTKNSNKKLPKCQPTENKSTNKKSSLKVNTSSEEDQSIRKSTRKRNVTPSAKDDNGENLQNDNFEEVESKGASVNKSAKLHSPRRKIIVTVVKNDDEATSTSSRHSVKNDNQISDPVKQIQKVQEAHLSSGYETSNSTVSNSDSETKKNTYSKSSRKQKKITDLLSPIMAPSKKRSDIYEDDSPSACLASPSSPVSDKSTNSHPQRQGRRKRVQSVPDESAKRSRFNSSEPECSPGLRKSRSSRVEGKNALTESKSDLSLDSSKSSGRKSSEEARKRMAVSLTRNYKSHALKVIVCTFLTASEQNGIDLAGAKLGGWKLEEKVTARTTHVINSGPKRTLNMLKGMARGCWLVDQKWMLDSAKAGTWLEEEKYELTKFSPAVKHCRMKRQAIGKDFKHNLFARSGPIFVSPKTEGPPAKDIRELLELCGADLKTSVREAKIVVGGEPSQKGSINYVHARWVLDSITRNKVLPMNNPDYEIK